MNLGLFLNRFKRLANHYFWHDKIIFVSFLSSIGINLANWTFLIWKLDELESIIPLHYNVYFGIDMIGPRHELFKMSGLGFIILLINIILAFRVYKHERLNAYFLVIVNVFVQFLLLAASVLIINL